MTFIQRFRLSVILLSGVPALIPSVSMASTTPVNLHSLVVSTGTPGVHISVPRTKAFSGSDKMVFRFMGTPKFFVGVIIQSFDAKGHLLHHGLFDQGPIDEVLSKALFRKEERIQIVGIFKKGNRNILRIRRFSTETIIDISLDRALSLITSRIGSQPDLVWAAR